jgi:hypothetical protein
MPNERYKGGFMSLDQSRYIMFKMIGGSSFWVDTCNTFKIYLFIEGILHIFFIGTVIFSVPNMLATSIFN